jgi:cyanophycinase
MIPSFADGIPGALILCGPGPAVPEAFLTFTRLAKPLEGKFVAVKDKAPDPRELAEATGVWWEFREPPKGKVLDALKAALARGATLGGNAAFTQTALKSGLLPDANEKIRYEFPEGSALAIVGREIQRLSAVPVVIRLTATKSYPEERIIPRGNERLLDLTALRRWSRQRNEPSFPPKKLATPNVPSGTLVIVGGGGMPQGLTQRFVELAGGEKAVIAVIPISMPDPLPPKDGMAEALRRAGAKEVVELTGRTPEAVDKPEVLEVLKRATGIWFGGGRQWRFIDAYENTKAAKLMHEVLKRGGVIGGSSAGASIQGEYMARGNPLGPEDIIAPGYERGLGFLPGMAIDQHFTQRNRFKDMELLIKTYPQLLGVGLDEATAIIVQGSLAEVTGRTRVNFYAAAKPGPESVPSGKKYDLATRKVVE